MGKFLIYVFGGVVLVMASGCGENINTTKTSAETTKPTKPTKPTREIIMDFCADASIVADRSPTDEQITDIAKYLGVEAKSYQYMDFYMAVLDANVEVNSARADRAFAQIGGGFSSQNIPGWEKACARSLREKIARW
jgi:hypothetical protein